MDSAPATMAGTAAGQTSPWLQQKQWTPGDHQPHQPQVSTSSAQHQQHLVVHQPDDSSRAIGASHEYHGSSYRGSVSMVAAAPAVFQGVKAEVQQTRLRGFVCAACQARHADYGRQQELGRLRQGGLQGAGRTVREEDSKHLQAGGSETSPGTLRAVAPGHHLSADAAGARRGEEGSGGPAAWKPWPARASSDSLVADSGPCQIPQG